MFGKEVYVSRRERLVRDMKSRGAEGIVLFVGNVDAAAQYKDNCYTFRQDSSWLYYFGLDEPKLAAIIDLESGVTTLFADDVEIDDIIWMGPMPSVESKAHLSGICSTASYADLDKSVKAALVKGRTVHYLPPSRYYNTLKLRDLLGTTELRPSEDLIRCEIAMRLVKQECEIEEIDAACALGYAMHTLARETVEIGILEREVVGKMVGLTLQKGWGESFTTICTQHGEILHNHGYDHVIEPGRLMVIDAGAEACSHYASDFTRTIPTSGKFTTKQKEVYEIVEACNELAFSLARPGVAYRDVHLAVEKRMLEGLKALNIVNGDPAEMVQEGICGLFMPHGLGHNMGLDVHDMEDLGEDLVGYDEDQKRASRLGLGSLRMARRLVPGNVITDEPGIYFVPALIDKWKAEGTDKGFVNFARLEEYRNFGGIRLEDDVLITATGARRLGPNRLPISVEDVESAMSK